jgi:ferredoxin-thioredoxin reductase catalytic subunit
MGGYAKMSGKKSITDVENYVKNIAKRNNWILNKDPVTFDDLVEGLQKNFNLLGYFNCPCRDSENNNRLDNDIICPCKYSKQDIQEFGYCYCTLYFDPKLDSSKKVPMIPERRPE